MDKDNASPLHGGADEPAFYTMKVARDFGADIARQYKATSPTHLVAAFVEGLMNGGDVVSSNQLLENPAVKKWLSDNRVSDRQLRAALNAARQVRRKQAANSNGLVVPPKRRRRASEKPATDA